MSEAAAPPPIPAWTVGAGGGTAFGAVGAALASGMTQEQTAIVVMAGAIVALASVLYAMLIAGQRRAERCEAEKLDMAQKHEAEKVSLVQQIATIQDARRTDALASQREVLALTQQLADAIVKPKP